MVAVIDDWVLSTVHMWVMRLSKAETRRLIEANIPFERVYEAFVKLSEEAQGVTKPVKHTGGRAGTAIEQTAKEIVDVIYDLDKRADCPRFILSSRELSQIPGTSISNSDVVPLGSRMEELEKTVGLLLKTVNDLKNAPVSFAQVANAGIGGRAGQGGGLVGQGGAGRDGVGQGGTAGRGDQPFVGARSRLDSLSGRENFRERLQSLSEKRKQDEMTGDNVENENEQFQYPRRRPRKVNYGKCNVDIAGGEAAPYEIFIGNTNPASTEEKIGEVLMKCADLLPEDEKLAEPLQILKVTA